MAIASSATAGPGGSAAIETARPEAGCGAPCILYVQKIGSGTGYVSSDPARVFCGETCVVPADYAERMTVFATPDPGSVFTGWTGECESVSGNACHLFFDIEKRAIAIFDRVGAPPTTIPPPTQTVPSASGNPDYVNDHPPLGTPCTVVGTAANDLLRGTPGNDVICGGRGKDTVFGGGGHDLVIGGPGDDRLYGQGGREHLIGGPGDNLLDGGPGDDELFAAAGADVLFSRDGVADLVHGGAGRDRARTDHGDSVRAVERRF
jgi:RTX calcium-binding nonapeptide repeat (4 copies)/Divergent InlB B-repeat domain